MAHPRLRRKNEARTVTPSKTIQYKKYKKSTVKYRQVYKYITPSVMTSVLFCLTWDAQQTPTSPQHPRPSLTDTTDTALDPTDLNFSTTFHLLKQQIFTEILP